MILTCGVFIISLASPAPALVSTDEDDKRCIIVARTVYEGDEYHADLYISDVTYENGDVYLNGEPYPGAVEKRISRLLSEMQNGSGPVPDPNHPGNPPPHTYLNQLNPVLQPVVKGVVGPVLENLDDWDLNDPPVIAIEVRLPSDLDDVDGNRVAFIVNTPICLSEIGA